MDSHGCPIRTRSPPSLLDVNTSIDGQITNLPPSYDPVCAHSPWDSTRRRHRGPVRRPAPRVRRALSLAPFAAPGLRLARSLIAPRQSPRLPTRARPSRSWPPQLSSRPRPLPRILTAPGSRSSSTELAVASLIHSSGGATDPALPQFAWLRRLPHRWADEMTKCPPRSLSSSAQTSSSDRSSSTPSLRGNGCSAAASSTATVPPRAAAVSQRVIRTFIRHDPTSDPCPL